MQFKLSYALFRSPFVWVDELPVRHMASGLISPVNLSIILNHITNAHGDQNKCIFSLATAPHHTAETEEAHQVPFYSLLAAAKQNNFPTYWKPAVRGYKNLMRTHNASREMFHATNVTKHFSLFNRAAANHTHNINAPTKHLFHLVCTESIALLLI